MSRLTAIVFLLLDSILSFAALLQSSLTFSVLLCVVIGSLAIGGISKTMQSLFWPRYFWGESDPRTWAAVDPKKA